LLLTLASAGSAEAQDDPATRSAAARVALRRAAASEREGALDSAYADVRRAQASWPEQPAYTETLARWAARRGDGRALVEALALLTRQRVGAGALRDSAVRALAARDPQVAERLAALGSALAPVDLATERLVTGDTLFWPEGLDADARDGSLYLTSMRHRNVLVVPRSGPSRWLLRETTTRPGAVMGVAVDAERRVIWLTSAGHPAMQGGAPGDTVAAELLRVRDGVVDRRWRLGDGTGMPGELAVAPDGEVVVSDAVKGVLHRLLPGSDSLLAVSHPLLRSPQGIAFAADGTVAWIADWSHGLLRWERGRGTIAPVVSADGATLLGIDGLRRVGDRLIAIQNGVAPPRVLEVRVSADGARATATRILDRPGRWAGEPTIGAVLGDRFVYVASSQWPFWTEDLRRIGTAPLPAVVLREVPLSR
jgi:sugar lactone lactonase YvrE